MMDFEKIDRLIEDLTDLADAWTKNNSPHHASELAAALAALIAAKAEWERSR